MNKVKKMLEFVGLRAKTYSYLIDVSFYLHYRSGDKKSKKHKKV